VTVPSNPSLPSSIPLLPALIADPTTPIKGPRPPLPFPLLSLAQHAARLRRFHAGVCRYPRRPSSIPTSARYSATPSGP
jgi:hypothetical protein